MIGYQMQLKEEIQKCMTEKLTFPESKNLQQRGIADKIEDECNQIIKEHFNDVVTARSRKSTEDISIGDIYIDHKTSDVALKFKMPNMISIDKLRRLDKEVIYNFVIYDSKEKTIINTFALSLYELNWDHLTIGNLGPGQLQIKSMKNFIQSPKTSMSKEEWQAVLREKVNKFYENLITKTKKRQLQWQ
jgi:hypothetical protein